MSDWAEECVLLGMRQIHEELHRNGGHLELFDVREAIDHAVRRALEKAAEVAIEAANDFETGLTDDNYLDFPEVIADAIRDLGVLAPARSAQRLK